MLIRLFTSKCAFYVGDSTAKVVNSEQITTNYQYNLTDIKSEYVKKSAISSRNGVMGWW